MSHFIINLYLNYFVLERRVLKRAAAGWVKETAARFPLIKNLKHLKYLKNLNNLKMEHLHLARPKKRKSR